MNPTHTTRLTRKLNLVDAVILGLGSMIGAGVFVSASPAAKSAGNNLLLGLIIAGCVAIVNALSMARLAAAFPESGGAYTYGRKLVSPFWGFIAGWGFIIGKLASCTAMALTFANYFLPPYAKLIAITTVAIFTIINFFGIKKTTWVTTFILIIVLSILITSIFAILIGSNLQTDRILNNTNPNGLYGILQSAGLFFFAFAGYARIATLSEEVINPKKTIPKAILISLGLTFTVYFTIMFTLVLSLDIQQLISTKTPILLAIESSGFPQLNYLVMFGASIASLGVLISLMVGISRTIFAMAANSDLPKTFSKIHFINKVPHYAEFLVGILIILFLVFTNISFAIEFSSFSILIYYAIANFAAIRLTNQQYFLPKLGLVVCLLMAICLPYKSIVAGLILYTLGAFTYYVRRLINKL